MQASQSIRGTIYGMTAAAFRPQRAEYEHNARRRKVHMPEPKNALKEPSGSESQSLSSFLSSFVSGRYPVPHMH